MFVGGEAYTLVALAMVWSFPFEIVPKRRRRARRGEISEMARLECCKFGTTAQAPWGNAECRSRACLCKLQLIVIHRAIRRTEIDRSFSHLLDPSAEPTD